MKGLALLDGRTAPLRVLAIGAHSDDIEIGCGGTLLSLIEQGAVAEVCWVVLTGAGDRADEARASAEAFLAGVPQQRIVIEDFPDGFLPYSGAAVKTYFEQLKQEVGADVVFTHQRSDLHQDHRLVCELTWNTFRDHLILEYEVPKFDGDLGSPNVFVPLPDAVRRTKIEYLLRHFPSQAGKRWFQEELFAGLLRLRGMECNAPSAHAEAFYCRKAVLAVALDRQAPPGEQHALTNGFSMS
jgi:LmbE family N-acetylglucosaminyl deacetylase